MAPEAGTPVFGASPFLVHPGRPHDFYAAGEDGEQQLQPPHEPNLPPRHQPPATAAVRDRLHNELLGRAGFTRKARSFSALLSLHLQPEASGCFVALNHAFMEALVCYFPGLWLHVKNPRRSKRMGDLAGAFVRLPGDRVGVALGPLSKALAEFLVAVDAAVASVGDPPEMRFETRYVMGWHNGEIDYERFLAANWAMFLHSRATYSWPILRDWALAVRAALALGVKICLNVLRSCSLAEGSVEEREVLEFLRDCCEHIRHFGGARLAGYPQALESAYGRPVLRPMCARLRVMLGLYINSPRLDPTSMSEQGGRSVALARELRAHYQDLRSLAAAAAIDNNFAESGESEVGDEGEEEGEDGPGSDEGDEDDARGGGGHGGGGVAAGLARLLGLVGDDDGDGGSGGVAAALAERLFQGGGGDDDDGDGGSGGVAAALAERLFQGGGGDDDDDGGSGRLTAMMANGMNLGRGASRRVATGGGGASESKAPSD